ncbi:MAG: hypothetical protein AB7S26_16420 [Sandaracinaceae bacterium]
MGRYRITLVVALLVACQFEARDGQFRCPDGERCPVGQTCGPDLVCHDVLPSDDAGGMDGAVQSDGGRDSGSRDAALVDADVDAGDVDAGPSLPEVCEPDPTTGAAVDEDRDGAIDETCSGWYFGSPHLVARIHVRGVNHTGLAITPDGQRAYVAAARSGDAIFTTDRGSAVRSPFASAPMPVVGTAVAGRSYGGIAMSADERILVAEAGSASLVLYERTSPSAPFVEATTSVLPAGRHPSLSADGLELFFATTESPPSIQVATRPDRASPFRAPDLVDLGMSGVERPVLSPDGRHLFFTLRASRAPYVVTRASDDTFGAPQPLGLVGFDVLAYVPRARELWLLAPAGAGQQRPPVASIHRVQVCRDHACPSEAPLLCPSGNLSADGFRCFFGSSATLSFMNAGSACGGGRLASVMTPEDAANASAAAMSAGVSSAWIGFARAPGVGVLGAYQFGWTSGEPVLYEPWEMAGGPMSGADLDCARILNSGAPALRNFDCEMVAGYVCEMEQLPEWLP